LDATSIVSVKEAVMSVRMMSKVFQSNLPPRERFVLLCYADFGNDDGVSIYPSVATIARKTGFDRRTVQRATANLYDWGIIEYHNVEERCTNQWKINVALLDSYRSDETIEPEDTSESEIDEEMRQRDAWGASDRRMGGVTLTHESLFNHEINYLTSQVDRIEQNDANASFADAKKELQKPPRAPSRKNIDQEDSRTITDELAPLTDGGRLLFERLTREARARGRRGPIRFGSLAQRDKFLSAEQKLADNLSCAIDKALELQIMSLPRIVAYLAAYSTDEKPRRNGYYQPRKHRELNLEGF
jgi:hypothetical protein